MNIIKIAICDDEQLQISYLKALVQKWAIENSIAKEVIVDTFNSAESFEFAWCEEKNYDILLLDIQMEKLNGIELARQIRKKDQTISIIFITGIPDYIGDGYEVCALHYLMKPVKEEKLFQTLNKALQLINTKNKSILVNVDGANIRILQSDIHFIEAFSHTILIHTASKSYEVKQSIGNIENELDSHSFIRCHRSYIVNLKYIMRISKTDISLDNCKLIPLSRRMYNDINQAFINYFKGE